MSKNDSKNNLELSGIPLLDLGQLIPDYSDLRIQDVEEVLEDLVLFEGQIDQIQSDELLNAFVLARVQECKSGKRKPEEHLRMFMTILKGENIRSCYNIMTHRNEIICNNWISQTVVGQAEEQKIYKVEEVLKKYNFPIRSVEKYLMLSAEPYHPVMEWINSKEWDGVDRFPDLFNSLGCINENQDLAKVYLWKWSLAGCRAILTQKGFVSENILVFKGNQGAGKTRWLYSLAPEGFVKTGLQLNPSNKDSVLEATSVWIAELGELDGTTTKSDTASLKAFFSKSIDNVRKPYGRTEELIPRKTIFCASVNTDTFLVDDTGNRRYWILEIKETNPKHEIDLQQYWSQVMETAKLNPEDHPHWLDKEEAKLQDIESKKFKDVHPLCQKILKLSFIHEKYTTTEIASLIDHENLKPHESKVIKQFMLGELGWSEQRRGSNQYWLINPDAHKPKKGEENEVLF